MEFLLQKPEEIKDGYNAKTLSRTATTTTIKSSLSHSLSPPQTLEGLAMDLSEDVGIMELMNVAKIT
jgi:hypothetical protein